MKYTATLLFLISSYVLSAQNYHALITPGKQSSIPIHCETCPSIMDGFGAQLYFEGDSLINGTAYQKLMMLTKHWYWGDNTSLAELLREDTLAHKMYRFAGSYADSTLNNPNYMAEELLWDYNLQIGDSILISYSFGEKSWTKINSIDTITLNNNHKVRVYKTFPGSAYTILFTEEIIMSHFLHWHYGMIGYYSGNIYCAQGLNGVGLYPVNCSSPNYIEIEETEAVKIEVYPNPAINQLVLKAPIEGDFELFDVLGKLVLKSSISLEEQQTVSVANLPAGMYVWVFRTEKGVEKGKLLIERQSRPKRI